MDWKWNIMQKEIELSTAADNKLNETLKYKTEWKKQIGENHAHYKLICKKLKKKSKTQQCPVLGKHTFIKLFLKWGIFRKVVPSGGEDGGWDRERAGR